MENKELNNIAFIDGQNLHLGTTLSDNPWKVKLSKFKIYLEKKYLDSKDVKDKIA